MTDQLKKNSIHECGHALFAKLFEEDFELISITMTPEIHSNQIDTDGWNGVAHIKPRPKTIANPTIENKDKLIISMWGGLVAQNIHLKGRSDFKKNINKYIFNTELLDTTGFTGDWEIIIKYAPEQLQIRNIPYSEYRIGLMKFAFDYFFLDEVWKTIESLSELVLSKDTLTLSQSEIEEHFEMIGFNKFINENRESILNLRYKK